MGLGPGGRGGAPATPILLEGPGSASLRLLPRSLSLPRTFPGQLGLKFSGEAAPSRGIRGGTAPPRSPPGPPPRPPGLATGRVTPRGGGGRGGAAEPGAGGEPGPAWDPSSAPAGGRGGAAADPARCNPPPAARGAARPGWALGEASPRDPRAPCPGGGGRAPGSWRQGGQAEPGVSACVCVCVGGSLSVAAWPRGSSPPPRALAERGTQTFRTSSISPGEEAASLPARPRAPSREPGSLAPSSGLGRLRT